MLFKKEKPMSDQQARMPLAPPPTFYPITEDTKCGNCKRPLMNPDDTLVASEWKDDAWYCKQCMRRSCHQRREAERIGTNILSSTDEQRADEQAGRFGYPPYFTR